MPKRSMYNYNHDYWVETEMIVYRGEQEEKITITLKGRFYNGELDDFSWKEDVTLTEEEMENAEYKLIKENSFN